MQARNHSALIITLIASHHAIMPADPDTQTVCAVRPSFAQLAPNNPDALTASLFDSCQQCPTTYDAYPTTHPLCIQHPDFDPAKIVSCQRIAKQITENIARETSTQTTRLPSLSYIASRCSQALYTILQQLHYPHMPWTAALPDDSVLKQILTQTLNANTHHEIRHTYYVLGAMKNRLFNSNYIHKRNLKKLQFGDLFDLYERQVIAPEKIAAIADTITTLTSKIKLESIDIYKEATSIYYALADYTHKEYLPKILF